MNASEARSRQVRFDDALPALVSALVAKYPELPSIAVFLRAADGRFTVVLPSTYLSQEMRADLDKVAAEAAQAYVDAQGACVTPDEIFEPDIFMSQEASLEEIFLSDQPPTRIKLIDRRIIGQDWSRPKFASINGAPPIVSFFSCKGGVGRSTALVIAAVGLAELGNSILIVDLDLEAPGLGALLLGIDDRPEFGAIDYLVENGISGADAGFIRACIAPSPLTSGKSGSIDVFPAIGQRGIDHPANVIPKLGRATLDDQGAPLVDQIRQLVSDASKVKKYDAILVDVRAGLSETSAGALLSLGGYMLLFGIDAAQTFEDYRYLFAHLRRYAAGADWRWRMQMVQAKSPGGSDGQAFREKASDLFAEFLYDDVPVGPAGDLFNFDIDDDLAPHYAWNVEFDASYLHFDPVKNPAQLDQSGFQRAFGDFVKRLDGLIFDR